MQRHNLVHGGTLLASGIVDTYRVNNIAGVNATYEPRIYAKRTGSMLVYST